MVYKERGRKQYVEKGEECDNNQIPRPTVSPLLSTIIRQQYLSHITPHQPLHFLSLSLSLFFFHLLPYIYLSFICIHTYTYTYYPTLYGSFHQIITTLFLPHLIFDF